jgi:hypothetical protein
MQQPLSAGRQGRISAIQLADLTRFFTEFTLSLRSRPFVSLRMTKGEGFRMTKRGIPVISTQLSGEEKGGGKLTGE